MRQALKTTALFLAVLAFSAVIVPVVESLRVLLAIWVLNALILAFVLRGAQGFWSRATAVVAAVAAMTIGSMIGGLSFAHSLDSSVANGVEIAIAAILIGRTPDPMATPRAFGVFLAGAVIAAPTIAGGIAALITVTFEHGHALLSTPKWIVSDALGMLIVGPVALSASVKRFRAEFNRTRAIFAVLGQAFVLGASVLIFGQSVGVPVFFIFPVAVAGALSHHRLGGLISALVVAVVSVICTQLGRGPAVIAAHAHLDKIFVMQVLVASIVLTTLPVTALLRKLDRSAKDLEEQRAQAEGLSEIKTRLLAQVSHEIRSPLSGVTSLAELMRDGVMGDLTPHQRDTLGQIAASGAEVEALARDLLDAATLQSGKATVHLSDVEVEDAVETAVTAARFRAKDFGGSVVVVGGYCGGLRVAADRLRLRQILINLIVNGLKYGGRPPLVQISAFATGHGTVRFEVSDNGSGVPREQRDLMFRSFDRLGAEKSDIEGAGLGLALSRELALLQGGRLGVDDGDLGGALFWLELPEWKAEARFAAA
jgi:signal transduction histidine kinase